MFGGDVGLFLGRLPLGPRVFGWRQCVPDVCFVRVAVGSAHGPVGRCDKDGVSNGDVGPLRLPLGFLQNVDVVGDAFGFCISPSSNLGFLRH